MNELSRALTEVELKNVASYVELPITDARLTDTLQARAGAFRHQMQPLPCVIAKDATYDMGSRRLNEQLFIAAVDLNKSHEILEFSSRMLAYSAAPENTGAYLILERTFDARTSRRLGRPVLRCDEVLLLLSAHKGRVSPHFITRSTMRSLVVDSRYSGKEALKLLQKYEHVVPHASKRIRAVNDQLIAWHGRKWGQVAFSADGNIILARQAGNAANAGRPTETLSVATLGEFEPVDVGEALRIGMSGPYLEYEDSRSGLVIPGPVPSEGPSGFGGWLMMQDGPAIYQTVGGGGGGPSGAGTLTGGAAGSDSTAYYEGTESCARRFNTPDKCYTCCDAASQRYLSAGIAVSTAFGGAVSIVATPLAGVLSGMGAVVVFAVVTYVVNDACKDECGKALGGSGPAVNRPVSSSDANPDLTAQ